MSFLNRKRWLAASLLIGFLFAFLTWVELEESVRLQRFDYVFRPTFFLVLPGTLASMIIGGNIHIVSTWFAAVANFGFYFALAYLAFFIWQRTKM
jgi:hypothetical protein